MHTTAKPAHAAGTVRLGELEVQRMGFGAMRVTGPGVWGPPPDRDAAKALLRRALDLGIDFLDTADSYGPHVSEEIIAEALHPYPQGLVIGTKGGFTRPGRSWRADGRPAQLRAAIDGSLKRLRLACIDLYQFRTPDSHVPFLDSVGTLAEAQRAGKIRHSNISCLWIEEKQDTYQLELRKVLGTENPADMRTKHRSRQSLDKCVSHLNQFHVKGRAKAGLDV